MEKFFVAVKLVLCCSADSVNTNQCGGWPAGRVWAVDKDKPHPPE